MLTKEDYLQGRRYSKGPGGSMKSVSRSSMSLCAEASSRRRRISRWPHSSLTEADNVYMRQLSWSPENCHTRGWCPKNRLYLDHYWLHDVLLEASQVHLVLPCSATFCTALWPWNSIDCGTYTVLLSAFWRSDLTPEGLWTQKLSWFSSHTALCLMASFERPLLKLLALLFWYWNEFSLVSTGTHEWFA